MRSQGIVVDLDRLKLDDSPTYAMLQKGDAGGVFQFESQGMRDVLKQMRPDRFEDLIAAVALYRPGPMANIPAYCLRKHGEAWAPPHPELHGDPGRDLRYHGLPGAGDADRPDHGGLLAGRRRSAAPCHGQEDPRRDGAASATTFTDGATKRGASPPAKAEEVFDLMAKFADYGFNKSHAAAYALVAYQTAWMKANHPEAFLAGCMSLAMGNTDKLAALAPGGEPHGHSHSAARHQPIRRRFHPGARWRGANSRIRYALAAVKKVGQAAMESLVAARGDRTFADLADLASRVDPRQLNKMQIENLVRAGAFDGDRGQPRPPVRRCRSRC